MLITYWLKVCFVFSPAKVTLLGSIIFTFQHTEHLSISRHDLVFLYTVFLVVTKVRVQSSNKSIAINQYYRFCVIRILHMRQVTGTFIFYCYYNLKWWTLGNLLSKSMTFWNLSLLIRHLIYAEATRKDLKIASEYSRGQRGVKIAKADERLQRQCHLIWIDVLWGSFEL